MLPFITCTEPTISGTLWEFSRSLHVQKDVQIGVCDQHLYFSLINFLLEKENNASYLRMREQQSRASPWSCVQLCWVSWCQLLIGVVILSPPPAGGTVVTPWGIGTSDNILTKLTIFVTTQVEMNILLTKAGCFMDSGSHCRTWPVEISRAERVSVNYQLPSASSADGDNSILVRSLSWTSWSWQLPYRQPHRTETSSVLVTVIVFIKSKLDLNCFDLIWSEQISHYSRCNWCV